MASKPKKTVATKAEKYPRKKITCQSGPSIDEQGRSYAKLITSPEFTAYRVIVTTHSKEVADKIDSPTLVETLRNQAQAVQGGDLTHAEAMLINQSSALQSLFARLFEKAMEQTYLPNFEVFMRLALRAQNQCRTTLETLSNIKNPPVVYAKQANITTGPQQVNNGTARAEENENQPNKLLEVNHGERLDFGTQATASGVNPVLETMGKIDRAEDTRRERSSKSKRL